MQFCAPVPTQMPINATGILPSSHLLQYQYNQPFCKNIVRMILHTMYIDVSYVDENTLHFFIKNQNKRI